MTEEEQKMLDIRTAMQEGIETGEQPANQATEQQ